MTEELMSSAQSDRRTFLARLGVLGAVAGTSLVVPAPASAAVLGPPPGQRALDELARRILDELTRDTFHAVGAFVVPGTDAYSRAQGTPRTEPGAIQARTPAYLIDFFDNYVPVPDELIRGICAALADGFADVPIQLPSGLPVLVPGVLEALDDAVRLVLRGPTALPLSLVIALLLNLIATLVNPASTHGAFVSPFARLSAGEKAVVVSLLEGPDLPPVAAIDAALPEPLRGSVSGLVRFLAGSMLELGAFGTYSEWSTFDERARSVRGRPIGWDISRFDPGVLDGWHDFIGYYQGRKEVSA
jgi:hypothetical protein